MVLSLSKYILRSFTNNSCKNFILKTSIAGSRAKNESLHRNLKSLRSTSFTRFSSGDSSKRVTIIFERPDGTRVKKEGKVGEKVQEIIGQFNPEFEGFGVCGGTLSCSTCHLVLSEEDYNKLEPPGPDEEDTLYRAVDVADTSRLACGLDIVPEMEGMVLKLPAEIKDMREG